MHYKPTTDLGIFMQYFVNRLNTCYKIAFPTCKIYTNRETMFRLFRDMSTEQHNYIAVLSYMVLYKAVVDHTPWCKAACAALSLAVSVSSASLIKGD